MTNTTIPDDWTGIPEEVEKIIASRTVKKTSNFGKTAIREVTRPFRFIEFSREVGLTNSRAHAYVKQGVNPTPAARKAIISWCKKNRRKGK